MRQSANEDSRWDAFTLITVVRANFRDVFAANTVGSTSEFEAKALLTTLLHVFEGRNSSLSHMPFISNL